MRKRARKLRTKPRPRPSPPQQPKRPDGPRPIYASDLELERVTYGLLREARRKARKAGEVFTLSEADIRIPDLCPATGISLYRGSGRGRHTAHSPALDTIDPARGWTPGNVVVVSMLAKSIMADAAPEEVFRIADWMEAAQAGAAPSADALSI